MSTPRIAYRLGLAGALVTSLILLWLLGAVGIVGVEGDPADRMYLGVLAVAVVGTAVARLRVPEMVRAMVVTAATFSVTAAIALLLGRHEAAHSSVAEILGLNVMFASGYLAAAWCFHRAASATTDGGEAVPGPSRSGR